MKHHWPGSRGAALAAGSILAVLSILLPHGVAAQDADRLADLEAQVAALMAEVQALKAQQAQQAVKVEAVARQAAAPQPRPVAVNAALAGDVAAAELSPNELPQPVVQTAPSPGIDGQPFFVAQPEGRRTGAMATGNDRVRVTFSGQINRALNYVNDGIDSDTYHVDNENASSRFRFVGESSPLNEWQAVSLFEFEWPTNGSLDVNQIQPVVPDAMNQTFNLRLLELGFANNAWGSFFIGQGWMASDGTSEIDISGITTPGWAGQTFAYGGMLPTVEDGLFKYQPRRPSSVPQQSDYATEEAYEAALDDYASNASNFVNIFGLGNDLDGLSRQKRVRY
uniref:porin n=1 Tax=Tropicimonas sp. IMCC34043 TaxID=2248760 RepID=UPI0013005BCC